MKKKRSYVVGVRFTAKELAEIKKMAQKNHMQRNTFIRATMLRTVDNDRQTNPKERALN